MRFVVRLAPLLVLTAGCGFAKKPYANDPLLRGNRAVWLARDTLPPAPRSAAALLDPPPQPSGPTSPRGE